MTLNIFDFDSTLFKSPEPNPALWNYHKIGKLKSMTSDGGYGWYQDTLTLDVPFVPEQPSRRWFNEEILDLALSSSHSEDHVCVLLTGRSTLFGDIINRIVSSVQLEFDHIGLKPIGHDAPNTFDFKIDYITQLLETYGERVDKLVIYEDRKRHAERFQQWIDSQLIKSRRLSAGRVILVQPIPKYLPADLEKQLVNQLMNKQHQGGGGGGYKRRNYK
ncbi:hypothetical protein SAMD00019534_088730 [Acytostelium subglobosum LB1]|uniref:hypothetical protein n=1 Tax=Acytostelium subglobosum LB1 TaxID=1410327 RepID=UPI000644F464|nr:hypothetical protein SAMD00019534_088730 [Acytostelium subglobosum LB1]GAM25698.1 hypothetical protein SAMD00019534_088730 [Acytostelium subglobosum LB1]|eukprot:XP_012751216.1 hypothetical protein SAMD00019534_088730 [Acytostelium subglobosum LB1]